MRNLSLATHTMRLNYQISHTTTAVNMQETLFKRKAMESERHQVDAILDDDLEEVVEDEKLEEGVFLVESFMPFGSSKWC